MPARPRFLRPPPDPLRLHLALAATLLAGCAAGPDYQPPAPPSSQHYTPAAPAAPDTQAPASAAAALPGPWWEQLQSPALNALITQALAASPTIAAAQATLAQAQALEQAQARTRAWPQVDASVGAQRQQTTPALQGQSGEPRSFNLYSANVQVRWQADLSGAQQRTLQALAARTRWRAHELAGARLQLAGHLATTAIARARLHAQWTATQALAQQQDALAALAEQRLRLGQASADEAQSLQAQAALTRASLAPLQLQLQQTEHLLAVLAGQAPAEATLAPFTLQELHAPPPWPQVLPSELVRRRPDIQASEALLHAAHAERGATLARRYPQLQLSASLGSQALTTGALFGTGAAVWALGGQLAQPLFNPAQSAQEDAAQAALQAAAAQYQGVVLQALRQVADALRAMEHGAQQQQALDEAAHAAHAAAHTVQQRYRLGAASYAQLLLAQQQATQAALQQAQGRAQRLSDSVALSVALGGFEGENRP